MRMLQPSPQVTSVIPIAPPSGGINAVDSLVSMPENDAIVLTNMVPSTYGVRVRTGYREWATNVSSAVKTLMPVFGSSTTNDKLFCAGVAGIYDVTASGSSFTAVISFPGSTSKSGQGQFVNYTTTGGHFGIYCDEEYGYYLYTASGSSWARVTNVQVTGVNPNNLVFPCIYKSKIWFVEKDTAYAWYLPTGSVTGAATQFNFGNKFRSGGYLVALYSWTVDGGEGVDDYLVAISSGGDVVIYKGNDPASATDFVQHGSWFVGPPPAGRRVAGAFGGELYILSSYGILPISRLLNGAIVNQDETYLSRKITPFITQLMQGSRSELGWEIQLVPSENSIIVGTPAVTGQMNTQYVLSLNTQGWSKYEGIPYYTGAAFQGQFYIAALDGKVYRHSGNLDAVNLAETSSTQIEWGLLKGFYSYGKDGHYKRVHFIRPVFIAEVPPGYTAEAKYDYDLSIPASTAPGATLAGALWDTAVWDGALWEASALTETEAVNGGVGMGRTIAISMRGKSGASTYLIRIDVMADVGGML